MIATLHQIIAHLCHTMFTMVEMILVIIALCVVSSFFLVIVTLGAASTGAYALSSRWDQRQGRRRGARERQRLSFLARRKLETTRRGENLERW